MYLTHLETGTCITIANNLYKKYLVLQLIATFTTIFCSLDEVVFEFLSYFENIFGRI